MPYAETPSAASIQLVGNSEPFLAFIEEVSRAAGVDRPVLVIGERGTGKELAAARLHYLSARWNGPYVRLNCAALPESLLEAELFGHEAGAFTGAAGRREGRFEAADGGTLFLDEIAAMPLAAQEKILRVVEYGEFERLGSTRSLTTDVRLVAATNADLPSQADKGRFKADLLDRLAFEVLTVPPLRERGDDIMLLAEHFAAGMAHELDLDGPPEITAQAREALQVHDWPGNVRELKNVVERAVFRANGAPLEEIAFDPFASPYRPAPSRPESASGSSAEDKTAGRRQENALPETFSEPMHEQVRRLEIRLIRGAMARARHNQRRAAELLGLTYHQFRGLYRKYTDELT
jgi:psp operon transcriptional activator